VIVGYCEILQDEVELGSECEKRLLLIRETAEQIADLLNNHMCELDVFLQEHIKKSPELVLAKTKFSTDSR
jgi:hypothetical protein